MTDPTIPVAWLDEKWFYTTNRRRRLKHLPKAPWEEEGIDRLVRPRIVSRRHPVKVMYLGVVARPRENFDFDGRVYLERVSKKKVITKETTHTRFTDDVIMNADLRQNGWRRLVPDGSAIKVADLIDSIVEEYDIDEEVAERLEFSYKTFVGNQGNEKGIRYGDTDSLPSRTRRNSQDNTVQAIPVTLNDITLQVRNKQGDEIEDDVSCDSEFMLGVMDRVGEALRKAFYWVRQNEWIYLVMDNAGGHGTAEAWETFTNSLTTKYKVKII